MGKELELSFPLTKARMYFIIETVDGESSTFVDVEQGYELIERMKQFATGDYKALFEDEPMRVHFAHLEYIEYKHEQDGVDIRFKIDSDDVSTAKVKLKTDALEDENAKKIAMIREVLDFDKEAESSLLRDLFK